MTSAAHSAPRTPGDRAPTPSPFTDSLGVSIIAAGRLAQRLFDAELARIGLTMRHLGALAHLARNPELSISDLARRSGVTAQSMHATVRGLNAQGAVDLADQGRGRAARVTVTPEGHRLLTQAAEATTQLDQRLIELLGESDAAALRRLLTTFNPGPPTG